MDKRYISIWFRHLNTDWFSLRQPQLHTVPFVLRTPSKGRMVITSVNAIAKANGIDEGMILADARAVLPELQVLDDIPDLSEKLLKRIAEWCIRFTPAVAIDLPNGLLLDVSGCSHLWGGDENYVTDIIKKLNKRGYNVRIGMADTIGAAWAIARYSNSQIIERNKHSDALMSLPPSALRLEEETIDRLHKLGLHKISQFIQIPRSSMRRRFGPHILTRIDMALGYVIETLEYVCPAETYHERLPCLEPIVTAIGIEIALKQLLEPLCLRLLNDQKGLRVAHLKCCRVDGKTEEIKIETGRPSHNVNHLFKLFEIKIPMIEPGMGIEVFILEASKVEDHLPSQEKMWTGSVGLDDIQLSELLDKLANKIGINSIHRYLPAEHYWPERSYKSTSSLQERAITIWRKDKLRPIQVLRIPERIDVTAPIPDYPPMVFIYKGKTHQIVKADGPERIEQEWWLQQGQHRDYYRVEDEDGKRYWVFRSGHYQEKTYQWFIHGFFA